MQLNTFIVMNNGCSFYSSVFLISWLVLIIGKMLWLQRTIPFTEGQLEREIIVKMIRSGELPLLDPRIAQEPKILHARINLPWFSSLVSSGLALIVVILIEMLVLKKIGFKIF